MLRKELSTKGGINADDLGLGKTVQTIATMLSNPQEKPTLVVVPNALVSQWVSAVKRFANKDAVYMTVGDAKSFNSSQSLFREGEDDVVVTTYSVFQMNQKRSHDGVFIHPLARVQWGRIVLDEAHLIKNPKTNSHQQIASLRSNLKWALSGSPITKDINDFGALLSFLGVVMRKKPSDEEIRKLKNLYMIRRTKNDVANSNERLRLPPVYINTISVPFETEEELEIYEGVKEYTRSHMVNSQNAMEILEMFLRLRQICIHPAVYEQSMRKKDNGFVFPEFTWVGTKFNMLLQSIKNQKKNEKSLVFCQFVEEIKIVNKLLLGEGFSSFILDGRYTSLEKQEVIDEWKGVEGGSVLIIQISVGSVGLNLQEAVNVYIISPSWSPSQELQAIGRSHRNGQTQLVKVTRFVIQDTIEEHILELQNKKIELTAKTLGDPRILRMLLGDEAPVVRV